MLSPHFLPHLPPGAHGDPEELEHELARAVDRARAAHGGVALGPEVFLPFLASKVPPGSSALEVVKGLRTDSLWLALACARGDALAIAILDKSYFTTIERAVSHLRPSPALVDDVKQRLRERLLTREDGREPRIASEYGGRGDLGRWIRAAAVRLTIDVLRSTRREVADDDALAERAVSGDDPELEHMKRRYGAEFKAAVREALQSLDADARSDLRLYYVDSLKLDEIAALRHVAISTISRRLASARRTVLDATRQAMRRRLGASEEDVESILRIIGSRLDVSQGAFDPPT